MELRAELREKIGLLKALMLEISRDEEYRRWLRAEAQRQGLLPEDNDTKIIGEMNMLFKEKTDE